MSEPSGPTSPAPFATFDPDSSSWRTCLASLPLENLPELRVTWPRSGSMRNGRCYLRPLWEPPTAGSGCSSSPALATPTASIARGGRPQDSRGKRALRLDLLPTPRASDRFGPGGHGDGGPDLRTTISLLPTPAASRSRSGNNQSPSPGAAVRPSLDSITHLLPAPRSAAARTSRGAATRADSRAAPSLEQAVEIAAGQLPRELLCWEETPASWSPGAPTARPSDGGGGSSDGPHQHPLW